MAQDLTVYEGTPTYAEGRFYNASTAPTDKAWDGAVGRVVTADVSQWQFAQGTIDFWLRLGTVTPVAQVIIGAGDPMGSLEMGGNGSSIAWRPHGAGATQSLAITSLTAGTWYWVCYQWDGTNRRIWTATATAGYQVSTSAAYTGQNPLGASGVVGIGGYPAANAYDLVGRIDNLRVSNTLRIPMATDVAGLAALIPTAPPTVDANTVDLYRFDDTITTAVSAAPTPVTPTGPTWTDDATNGGGTWTTPTQTGVTYSPASGTATPGQAVTVTATATSGYTLTGATSWSHTFPDAPVVEPPPAGSKLYLATRPWVTAQIDALPTGGGATSWRNRTFNVMGYGATGNGTTDDTAAIQAAINAAAAAGGGRVVFPTTGAAYRIAGPLQDTGGANAQLVLPAVNYVAQPQMAITLEGEEPAPHTYSVIGTAPAAVGHTILKSTLTGAGNVIGVWHPTAFQNFSNLLVTVKNLTVRMPPNPAGTAINLGKSGAMRVDGVSVDTGDYSVSSLAEPTSTSAAALRAPVRENGAFTHIGTFGAAGMYQCVVAGEHLNAAEITSYGCKVAFQVPTGYQNHAIYVQRLNVHHQPYGIEILGDVRMDIAQYNQEHAAAGSWRTNVADILDTGNRWHGRVRWSIVTAGVGQATDFVKTGGSNVTATRVSSTA